MQLRAHCKKTHQAQDLCDSPAGGRAGHRAHASRAARCSAEGPADPTARSRGWCRGREPQLWKAREWADIWQIIQSRIVGHVEIGTFSSAKQSYFCLRENCSLQIKMLSNLFSFFKKNKASASLAYSYAKSPYRQKEKKLLQK